jgi:ketosteroid isomerase-like protein
MRMTNGEVAQESPAKLRSALAKLLAVRPRIRNTVRRVLSSDDIALVLLDWTLSVTLPDGQQHQDHGTARSCWPKLAEAPKRMVDEQPEVQAKAASDHDMADDDGVQ